MNPDAGTQLTLRLPKGIKVCLEFVDPKKPTPGGPVPGPCVEVTEDKECADTKIRTYRWNAAGCYTDGFC